MSRLEAAVSSPIAFRRDMSRDGLALRNQAETVAILFEDRLFVWHAFNEPERDPIFGESELGPSVTSNLGDNAYDEVATELERFLSALSYYYDQPAEVVAYGSHFATDPFEPPITRAPRTHSGWLITEPYESMSLRRDSEGLLKALAWHREGQNAGSPFYRFLAYWNCLEAVLGERGRDDFVERMVPRFAKEWGDFPLPASPAKDFKEASRNAIAHVVRHPGKPLIDPDTDTDRQRLESESRLLHHLARVAIELEFGQPVSLVA